MVEEGVTVSLLNVDQAAERLGTSPRFIRRLIAERRIAFTKLGRHVRIDSADIDAFVAAGRVEPDARGLTDHVNGSSQRTRRLRTASGRS
jgi:excisionase family DNA binding protein